MALVMQHEVQRSQSGQGDIMLKIEKDVDGCVNRLRLSGRIRSDPIGSIRSAMNGSCTHKILDLSEVTLVDIKVVRFLIRCEDEGIELLECPPYCASGLLGSAPSQRDRTFR